MPVVRAFSIAISAARFMTRWPMPLSPFSTRRAGMLVHDADVRPDVEAAGLDAPDILRQPADAVPVRTLQVGLRHQAGDGRSIGLRQAHRGERLLNEGLQPVRSN